MQIPCSILKLFMGKILSIDYGRKRIGLALSDEDEFIAFTLRAVTAGTKDRLIALLYNKIKELKPSEILVGLPLGIDLKPTQMSLEVEEFVADLLNEFKLPITKWNEVGTSKLASKNLRVSKKSDVDSESARIILQEYLDFKKSK